MPDNQPFYDFDSGSENRGFARTFMRFVLALVGIALVVVGVNRIMGGKLFEEPWVNWDIPALVSQFFDWPSESQSSFSGDDGTAVTLTFEGNGADSGGTVFEKEAVVGEDFTLPSSIFKRTGYHFTHWTVDRGFGRGVDEYLPGDVFTVPGPLTFSASWAKATPVEQVSISKLGEEIDGTFDDFDGENDYCVLLVTNDSPNPISIEGYFTYYANSGKEKGSGQDHAVHVLPGGFAILTGLDVYDASIASYTVKAVEPVEGMGALGDYVDMEEVSASADKTTIRITNKSEQEAQIYKVRCLMQSESGEFFVYDPFAYESLAPGKSVDIDFSQYDLLDYYYPLPVVPAFDEMNRYYFIDGYVSTD